MGRNLPGRKTLKFSVLVVFLLNTFILFSEAKTSAPKKSETNSNKTKLLNLNKNSYSMNQNLNLNSSNNNYKEFKVSDIPNINSDKVLNQINSISFITWRDYLKVTYSRLLPYRDYIATKVIEEKIPMEILYLPIVESAGIPTATSRAGATGLWQFMLNSSRPYNMVSNEWVEERRDFIKSTDGAIEKLKYNYKETGDWLLALAAYNCGLNKVKRVVKQSGISDYWELSQKGYLPRETVGYLPKLLAISSLLQQKHKYEIPIKWRVQLWDQIELDKAVDLRILSSKTGVPLNVLLNGNSELIYSVTPPTNSLYKLKIPSEYTDSVKKALDKQENLVEFYRYKVKSGDTLSEIGYYYGLSTSSLQLYNPGVSPRNLRIGKTLIVPAIKKVKPYGSEIKAGNFKNSYIVKNNDTLWGISLKFDTTIEELALNNGINVNDYIKEGMNLKVP